MNKYREEKTVVSGPTNPNRIWENLQRALFFAFLFLAGWLVGQWNSYKFLQNEGYEITRGCEKYQHSIYNKDLFDFTEVAGTIIVIIIIWLIVYGLIPSYKTWRNSKK